MTAGEIPAGPGGVMFIASALSSDRRPAIAVTTLLKPVLPTGELRSAGMVIVSKLEIATYIYI